MQLKMTEDELVQIEQKIHRDLGVQLEPGGKSPRVQCCCGLNRGPHVLLLSLIAVPFMWVYCTLQAFFLGSMTW